MIVVLLSNLDCVSACIGFPRFIFTTCLSPFALVPGLRFSLWRRRFEANRTELIRFNESLADSLRHYPDTAENGAIWNKQHPRFYVESSFRHEESNPRSPIDDLAVSYHRRHLAVYLTRGILFSFTLLERCPSSLSACNVPKVPDQWAKLQ
jgi:hypothetical protein